MASPPPQKLGRLFFPLFGLAVLTGAVLGALTMALTFLPSELSVYLSPGNIPIFLFVAAICGAVVSIPPAIGASVAVAIRGGKRLPSSGNRQALVAALGAAVGAVVPALAYLSISSFGPSVSATSLLTGTIFILVCFGLALATFRGMLSFISKRQKQHAGS